MNNLSLFNSTEMTSSKEVVTTKQLAEILGVGESTIKRAVEKLGSVLGGVLKNSQGGYLFNEEQATAIKQEIQKHHNLANREIDSVATDIEVIGNAINAFHALEQLYNRKEAEYKATIEAQGQQLAEQQPKVDFYDAVTGSDDCFDMMNVAKVLNIKGYGRNNLFEFLRNKGVLNKVNIPNQKYIEAGYFRVTESTYKTPDGKQHVNCKTVVYQKGVDYIRRLLKTI